MDDHSTSVPFTDEAIPTVDPLILQMLENAYMPPWTKPLCVVSSVLGFGIGIIGNSLVIVFFYQKRKKIASNFFIFLLAVVDLFVCVVLIPFTPVFVYSTHLVVFSEWFVVVQHIWGYIFIMSILFSLFLFDAIAIDRYRAICKALKQQMNFQMAVRLVLLGTFACSSATIWAYYNKEGNNNPVSNRMPRLHSKKHKNDRVQPDFAHQTKSDQLNPNIASSHASTSSKQQGPAPPSPAHAASKNIDVDPRATEPNPAMMLSAAHEEVTHATRPTPTQPTSQGLQISNESSPRMANTVFTRKNPALRTIRMLFVMTFIFFASYAPVLIITMCTNKPTHLIYTYIINHVANPFVQFGMNQSFRTYAKSALSKFILRK
ncbi:hypothetical protein CAPTEDRAFT_196545 [Capitella teleta]|uniref:G-protein coupled receptors family 1 profile domain-containing protein n=1 Tax=Capitella teleta TaxID=283909 RepID=R7U665_CAPTE|nr:hypothetical protein CAPTEDRAFT_196545 [Capitella teleta]|eukprot:ELT98650.1 hypothetical protein CAPTEDRAFT_196545 [Capitella teleta]